MTRSEARNILREMMINYINYGVDDTESAQAINVAIKVLEEPEITEQQLREYCHKRCLTIITNDMFEHLTRKEKTDETN